MNYKSILIVGGEPNSIFLEIYFKTLKLKKFKNPLILVTSKKLLKLQMKHFKFKKKIRDLDHNKLHKYHLDNKSINLIDVKFDQNKAFKKISNNSNSFIKKSFILAFKILKKYNLYKLINGPITKKTFLKKKYPGITEYISKEFKVKNNAMLIYNKKLSVCPLTTHIPVKSVTKYIQRKNIVEKVKLIDNFFQKQFSKKPRIGVLGLNPHCESIEKFSEDDKIIGPTVNFLKRQNFNISGPYSADTIFTKNNRRKFDVILGMYHDQVLTPIKTLYEYDAINITLGLPFIRVSPDHGPNETMVGKNLSNPFSLIQAINFLDKN